MIIFDFNPETYSSLIWFKDSPDTGDPRCLCSFCGKVIESDEDSDEPTMLRVFRQIDNTELRLHWSCAEKVVMGLGRKSDRAADGR